MPGRQLQLEEVGVHRELRGLGHGDRLAVPDRVAHRVPAVHLLPARAGLVVLAAELHRRARVELLVDRDALLQGRGQGEQLEGRPGLVALDAAHLRLHGQVPVGLTLLLVVTHHRPALGHGDDQAGARLDHVHGRDDRVPGPDHVAHVLLGQVHRLRVDLGLDGQPAPLDHVLPVLDRLAEAGGVEQRLVHVVAQERVPRTHAAVAGRPDLLRVEAGLLGLLGLLGGDQLQLGHPVEHHVAPVQRRARVADRVDRVRVLHQPGEHGRLGEVQLSAALIP